MTAQTVVRLSRVRRTARRLVVEVTVVGLLALTAMTTVPKGQHSVAGWGFLAPGLLLIGHALAGAVVVVDGLGFVLSAAWTASRRAVYVPAVGLAGAVVSLVAGAAVLWGASSTVVWFPMLVGWTTAVSAYVAEWGAAARTLRLLRPVVEAP